MTQGFKPKPRKKVKEEATRSPPPPDSSVARSFHALMSSYRSSKLPSIHALQSYGREKHSFYDSPDYAVYKYTGLDNRAWLMDVDVVRCAKVGAEIKNPTVRTDGRHASRLPRFSAMHGWWEVHHLQYSCFCISPRSYIIVPKCIRKFDLLSFLSQVIIPR